MKHSTDYRLIFQPQENEHISVVIPTGEVDMNGVKSRLINWIGHVEFTDVDLTTFQKICPNDRIFRNSWKLNSSGIIENIRLSKALLRQQRNAALNYLDSIAVKESRKPSGNIEIVDKVAQNLRDIPTLSAFKSEKILELKGLAKYIENLIRAMPINNDINIQYIGESLIIKENLLTQIKNTIASFGTKTHRRLLAHPSLAALVADR